MNSQKKVLCSRWQCNNPSKKKIVLGTTMLLSNKYIQLYVRKNHVDISKNVIRLNYKLHTYKYKFKDYICFQSL